MLWGSSSGFTDYWDSNVASALAAGSTHLLAFNEPDHASQSNMSPADAAAAYKKWMQPYAGSAKLGSPAVTNGNIDTMGYGWLSDFHDQCTGCTIDFTPVHWYHNVGANEDFKSHVTAAYTKYGKPVWVTEFGLNTGATQADIVAFLEDVLPWLDAQDFVERYSYFMVAKDFLVDSTGTALSTIGKTYASTS